MDVSVDQLKQAVEGHHGGIRSLLDAVRAAIVAEKRAKT
jgi:hypothetical protein